MGIVEQLGLTEYFVFYMHLTALHAAGDAQRYNSPDGFY